MAESVRAPEHGGRLKRAAEFYDIPEADWLDLSTGISPRGWPLPPIPPEVWRRLPEDDDGLAEQARAWAGAPSEAGCLPIPGSQAAIQTLPRLRSPGTVGVVDPGYAEHAWCWRQAGHEVIPLASTAIPEALDRLDVVVWIQPNNPTGEGLGPEKLREWRARLVGHGGWLVIDEAFIDTCPEWSLAPESDAEGLVVLRSLGKFFGLAGARAGFALGPSELIARLGTAIGPWAVPHPTRWLMGRALADTAWQQAQREWLDEQSRALDGVLERAGLQPSGGTPLFRYCPHPRAGEIQEQLARNAILVRRFESPSALRFGLPADSTGLERLAAALGA